MNESTASEINETIGLTFETVIKAIPLIVGFFIVCGSLYLETYYNCFHINIFNYLDTSEILTGFLYLAQEIVFIFSCAIGYIMILKTISWAARRFKRRANNVTGQATHRPIQQNTISFIAVVFSLILCLFYIMKSFTIEIDSNYIIKNKDWMRHVLIIFTLLNTAWLTNEFEAEGRKAIKNIIFCSVLFFVSFSVSRAVQHIEDTVNNVDLSSTVIADKDTIRTSAKYIYVGRTNNYVFFFDVDKKIADVIPQNVIKKISFRSQRP